jgi:ElaB/YqjD/DUF883 family membrane-anchored ribosome-binding protein
MEILVAIKSWLASEEIKTMTEATGNEQLTAPNVPIIYGSESSMSEFAENAHEYGRKIADAASRASDYLGDKVGVVSEKIKDLQGKDFSEIADEAKDYARRKPGHAILISAAAGLFLGLVLRGVRR